MYGSGQFKVTAIGWQKHERMHLVCIWWAFGVHLVCIWCASGVHLVSIWWASGVHLVCIWCASGVHLVSIWCATGVHLVCIWCAGAKLTGCCCVIDRKKYAGTVSCLSGSRTSLSAFSKFWCTARTITKTNKSCCCVLSAVGGRVCACACVCVCVCVCVCSQGSS